MSAHIVFYRNGWLKEGRTEPKPTSIEKSLAELDALLSQEDETKELAAEADEHGSIGSQKCKNCQVKAITVNNGYPSRIHRKGKLDSFIDSPGRTASTHSPGRKSDRDNTDSVSSNTINSRDATVHSHDVIHNIDEVDQEEALSVSLRSYSSRRSRRSLRSKSTSSSRRKKRGDSLERDDSRTILQLASDSSQFSASDQNKSKSVMDILKDLMATPLPMSFFGRDSAETTAAPEKQEIPASESETSLELRNNSLFHQEDNADDEVSTDNRKRYLQDSSGKAHNSTETSETSKSSNTSNSTNYLSRPAGDLSYSSESLEAPAMSDSSELRIEPPTGIEDNAEYESESIVALSGKPDRAVTKIKLSAQSLEASFRETLTDLCIPEESESDIVESYATGGMIAITPLLGICQDAPNSRAAPSPNENFESLDGNPDSSCASPCKVDTTVLTSDTSCLANIPGDSLAIDQYNDDDDDDWTTFGESVFSDSFSPDKRSSPTPTKSTEPESPKSVFKLDAEADMKITTIPDEGHEWQQLFPHPSSSDSSGVEWEQYNRRFAI
jgi:hypothetical protein